MNGHRLLRRFGLAWANDAVDDGACYVRLVEVIQPGLVEAYSEVDTAFVACTSTVGSRYGRGSMGM